MKWIDAKTACALLGVKPASLYAYVSRGRVRARTGVDDPRSSLYSAADIDQLLARKRAGRRRDSIARGAIGWGEPILESAITTVTDGRLIFRGRDAIQLSESYTLEAVASLLWGEGGLPAPAPPNGALPPKANSKTAGFLFLAGEAAIAPPSTGRDIGLLAQEASGLLQGLSRALSLGAPGEGAHQRLAHMWALNAAQADILRRALVLLADHELNPSTFAARIAASTGASLAGCALAGYATLTGPFHGEAAAAAIEFLQKAARFGPTLAVKQATSEGRRLAGVGHKLYPDGDPRAASLLRALDLDTATRTAIKLAVAASNRAANIDMALAALTLQFKLPTSAPFTLFAMARMAGWLAHGLEQSQSGAGIRPRARYVGQSGV
jgi:citrate synthase